MFNAYVIILAIVDKCCMTDSNKRDRVIISVSGSLISPNGGIGTEFLIKFNKFIRDQLAKNPRRQFFLVIGGGAIARHYIEAGREVLKRELSGEDLDWLGIHATRMNAHLVRTIFRDIAHPYIIDDYDIIRKARESVVVAAGWRPGWSTDFCAILLCEDYKEDTVINLGSLKQLYTKDPEKFNDAEPIDEITWENFRKIISDKWTPGLHVPFDPVASKRAQDLGIKVVILTGKDFQNLENYFNGESYIGTIIESKDNNI